MSIKQQIKEDLKNAMRNKDKECTNTLKGLLSAFTNELVASGRKPTDELKEEEIIKVIKRASKQRKDSIEQFKKGGRNDLAEKEVRELAILQNYLPEEMSEDEIRKIAQEKIKELGIDDSSKSGIVVGAIMKEVKGNADGALVKKVVEELL